MTTITEPTVPDDPSELLDQPLPELELMADDPGNQIVILGLDPDSLIPVSRDFDGEIVAYTAEDVADLISSVSVLGFLQPGLVIPLGTEPETHSLLIGNRRRAAAKFLGRKLPCIVVDSAETAQQVLAILHENDARLGLKPSQRAALYQQLTLMDWKPEMIARASGHKNAKQVTAALSLVQLPPAAKQAADAGQLDLTLAAELSEFADDPKTLAKIIDRGNSTWGFRHAISDARQRKQKDDAADMIFAELTMAGLKITSKPKDFGYSSREASVDRLADADGVKLDPMQVRTKPGFAAFIDKQAYGGPQAIIYCVDPEKYGYARIGHTSYVTEDELRRQEQERTEAQAFKEALLAAEPVRREFLKGTYGNAKAAKANYVTALRAAVADPGRIEPDAGYRELVDAIAGCPVNEHVDTAGIDRLTRMVVALWLAADEHNLTDITHGQRYAVDSHAAREYLDRLVADGYELSEAEAQVRASLQPTPQDNGDHEDDDEQDEGDGQ